MKIRTAVRYKKALANTPFSQNTRLNETTGCVEWTGDLYPTGYGRCRAVIGEPETLRAHRRSWEMNRGEIPSGIDVLHRCDNPKCVNVEHLFLGTDADNAKDKCNKQRAINCAGAEHGMSKLEPEDVLRIREASLFGASFASLGRAYGVNEATVAAIVKRKIWKHLG